VPGGVLRVYAISFQEASQTEAAFEAEVDAAEAARLAQEFLHEDCAFQLETRWDLWQWDGEWRLQPSKLTLECYGPLFDTLCGEHVLVDAGDEALFLPHPHSDQLRPVQSNIRSLLHLASDLEEALAAQRKLLWSENEEDFAERLQAMLG
jgi:hypothetical protein